MKKILTSMLLILFLAGTVFSQTPTQVLSVYDQTVKVDIPTQQFQNQRERVRKEFKKSRNLFLISALFDSGVSAYAISRGRAKEVGAARITGGKAIPVFAFSFGLSCVAAWRASKNPDTKKATKILNIGSVIHFGLGGVATYAAIR